MLGPTRPGLFRITRTRLLVDAIHDQRNYEGAVEATPVGISPGGTPRIEIAVAAERIGRGDVRIALADSGLTVSMTVEKPRAGD
jgi:hypothetical protein